MQKGKASLWILGAIVILLIVIGFVYFVPSQQHDEAAAQATVTSFGEMLQQVSLLAPNASSTIAANYGRYVTPQLLAQWEANPGQAPGRSVSSPWPDHIVVDSMRSQGSGYIVNGHIVLMTSTGEVGNQPIIMQLINDNGQWLIAAYQTSGSVQPTVGTSTTATSTH